MAANDDDYNSDAKQLTNFDLLANRRYLFACISGSLGYFLYDFMAPILAIRMNEFNLD